MDSNSILGNHSFSTSFDFSGNSLLCGEDSRDSAGLLFASDKSQRRPLFSDLRSDSAEVELSVRKKIEKKDANLDNGQLNDEQQGNCSTDRPPERSRDGGSAIDRDQLRNATGAITNVEGLAKPSAFSFNVGMKDHGKENESFESSANMLLKKMTTSTPYESDEVSWKAPLAGLQNISNIEGFQRSNLERKRQFSTFSLDHNVSSPEIPRKSVHFDGESGALSEREGMEVGGGPGERGDIEFSDLASYQENSSVELKKAHQSLFGHSSDTGFNGRSGARNGGSAGDTGFNGLSGARSVGSTEDREISRDDLYCGVNFEECSTNTSSSGWRNEANFSLSGHTNESMASRGVEQRGPVVQETTFSVKSSDTRDMRVNQQPDGGRASVRKDCRADEVSSWQSGKRNSVEVEVPRGSSDLVEGLSRDLVTGSSETRDVYKNLQMDEILCGALSDLKERLIKSSLESFTEMERYETSLCGRLDEMLSVAEMYRSELSEEKRRYQEYTQTLLSALHSNQTTPQP